MLVSTPPTRAMKNGNVSHRLMRSTTARARLGFEASVNQ
jgi:hypothetical protein